MFASGSATTNNCMGKVCRILFLQKVGGKNQSFLITRCLKGGFFWLGLSHGKGASGKGVILKSIYTSSNPFWRMLDFFGNYSFHGFFGTKSSPVDSWQDIVQQYISFFSPSNSAILLEVLPVLCGQWWAAGTSDAPTVFMGAPVVMDFICWDHVPLSYW